MSHRDDTIDRWKFGCTRRTFLVRASQLAAFGTAYSLIAPRAARADAAPGETVETTHGKLRGQVSDGIHSFKGVHYGASTAGENRFLPPQKPASWTGIRDAFAYGPQSPQNMRFTDVLAPQADPAEGFTEDCLVLNVWTPAVNDGRKRPVLFWCHGGGFGQESGSWPWIDGASLAKRGDAVVITINHRLGLVGYLHLADVAGEKYAASGNAGMLDLVAGLQWVRDNIERFGGDPANVMIFGESGGGAKVSTLLTMPAAKGLFHRAVVQSGASIRRTTREQASATTNAVLKALGLEPASGGKLSESQIAELAKLPLEKLVEVQARAGRGFGSIVDGSIVPHHPFDPKASPISATIPIMVGCTREEQTFFALRDETAFNLNDDGLRQRVVGMVGAERADRVLDTYRKAYPKETPSGLFFLMGTDRGMRANSIRLAERKFEQGQAPVYMYLFAWRSPAMEGKLRAPHTVEIPFVFDNTHIAKIMTGATPAAKALAAKTADAWLAFARNGNPNHSGLPSWPAYTTDQRATMVFDNECQVVNDPGKEARELWAQLGSAAPA